MPDLFGVTLEEEIAEVKRELDMRAIVYPRLIAAGKLKPHEAERRNSRLQAVLRRLHVMQEDPR